MRKSEARLIEIISGLNVLPPKQVAKNFIPMANYLGAVQIGIPADRLENILRTALPNMGEVMDTLIKVWMNKGLQQGLQQGIEAGIAKMSLRQLERRFGHISARAAKQIQRLPLAELEELCEALLEFDKPSDLTSWLRMHNPTHKVGQITS